MMVLKILIMQMLRWEVGERPLLPGSAQRDLLVNGHSLKGQANMVIKIECFHYDDSDAIDFIVLSMDCNFQDPFIASQ